MGVGVVYALSTGVTVRTVESGSGICMLLMGVEGAVLRVNKIGSCCLAVPRANPKGVIVQSTAHTLSPQGPSFVDTLRGQL
ncbi:hypothetical protein M8818_003876 [Zalaria obscura]|uniref:Uncharacterized protein n=1 Tax=Zalaria obscura TaxID=2024903 RepID=A0ACC3SEK7_9PEZI